MAAPTATHFSTPAARHLPASLARFFARYYPGTHDAVRLNPFEPTVHTATGNWHHTVFSLRRQNELCKMARRVGVKKLLPQSKNRSMERAAVGKKRNMKGLSVTPGLRGTHKQTPSPAGHPE